MGYTNNIKQNTDKILACARSNKIVNYLTERNQEKASNRFEGQIYVEFLSFLLTK